MNYLREELENGVDILDRSNADRYKAEETEEQEDESENKR